MNFIMSTIAKAGVLERKTKTSNEAQNTQVDTKYISNVQGRQAALELTLPQTRFFPEASL